MERQYILSERAHFMCPNMNFGMLMKMNGDMDIVRFEETLNELAAAHPFLRAVVAYEDNSDKLFYDVSEKSQIELNVYDGVFKISDYEGLMKKSWNVFEEGLLKVNIYKVKDCFEVLLMAHHLLTDGSGLLQLAQEIADNYMEGKSIEHAAERLIGSVNELPAGSDLSGISRFLIKRANKQWLKENHKVSFEQYTDFVNQFNEKHKLEYQQMDVGDLAYQEMKKICKENDVTINDLLMAKMYIKTGCKKIIIAADIRNKLSIYNKGTLGNYATAMGIECKSKTTDEIAKAKEVHKLVINTMKDNKKLMLVLACYFLMEPTLLDAAAISGLGGFESKAASFVGGGMFGFASQSSYSITNLGKIENRNMESVMFLPPASPAAKLTLGVVTLNEHMYGCTSRSI